MTNRIKILISILISIILFVLLFNLLSKNERTFINILSIVGFLLSALGIVIAFIQIISIKQIAIETREKVKESINLNNNILMISDLSRKAAIVDEIQGYLRADKIEMCILRMKDLKIIMNHLKNQNQYYSLVPKKQFQNAFENFNIDLHNFQTHHLNNAKMDLALVIKNLEELSTLFLSMETKLKDPQL